MAKIITMGEIMLRLSTPSHQRFIQADQLDVNYGGGEANVAVSLTGFGHETEFITAVPDNPIGQCAVAALRKYGVGTKYIARSGDRLGIYFLESGTSMRPSNVVYDRKDSAIALAEPGLFDFEKIFQDADWFHFTGITPAIGPKAAALAEEALKAAKKQGLTVSVDLNYRKKLWSQEEAKKVMTGLMKYVDVCIGNEEDAQKVLGFEPGHSDVNTGHLELEGYHHMFSQMVEEFGFQYVVSTLRESHSASHNGWSACIMDGKTKEFYRSSKYTIHPIVDRVGAGDAFAAGLICGLADGKNMKDALEFAAAASALKHTIPGDFNLVTRQEAERLAHGERSGRVDR
ncbi:sugar kinase [Lachnoclostridium edouardi]|uniref:sugar kinase n=1 Tax=Lachnoclostridium edouardi TaxID=1926283 RepID=UPI000C7E3ADE|nr:sugar kinase [Lachnoclostridium edouardi]